MSLWASFQSLNLANKLTLSRIIVIPFFILALVPHSFGLPSACEPVARSIALFIFIAASITDYYDGVLARRNGWITNFGKLMDPLADKILVMAAFVGLVELKIFPAWMVVLVLAREFLITGLRMMAAVQGQTLGADRWGKNKTISQLATIITALVYQTTHDWLAHYGIWETVVVKRWQVAHVFGCVLHAMMLICVILTVASGWRYCAFNWDVFREDRSPK